MSRLKDELAVCEQCGKLHRWVQLGPNEVARCIRCDASLGRGHRLGLDAVIALTVTAAIAFVVGVSSDVVSLKLGGIAEAATLPHAVWAMWQADEQIIAVVAFVTTLLAPALFIALRLFVLVPVAFGRTPPGFAFCIRTLYTVAHWNMVEVFTIGVLLSLVRLSGLADAVPGIGLFALGSVALLFAAIESAGVKHLWPKVG